MEIYRDRQQTELVASGERTSATGSVALSPEGGSGPSGSLAINFDAGTDDVEIAVIPQYLSWRLDSLRSRWFTQDWPVPLSDNAYPLNDPDLIGPADLADLSEDEPAFALWQAMRQEIDDLLADVRTEREADGLAVVVETRIGESLSDLRLLRDQLPEGQDVEKQISDLGLSLPAFLRLLELADLIDGGGTVLEPELEEIDSILAKAQKVTLLPVWIDQEIQAGVALSPDHFRSPRQSRSNYPSGGPRAGSGGTGSRPASIRSERPSRACARQWTQPRKQCCPCCGMHLSWLLALMARV